MRFAKDRSNVDDFAYFVGGSVATYYGIPTVLLADSDNVFINPGHYAIVVGDKVQKWYSWKFEELMEPPANVEELPAGWEAYPEDFDFSVFGQVVAEIKADDAERLSELIYRAKVASFLTRKAKLAELEAHPDFPKIALALTGKADGEVSTQLVAAFFQEKTALGEVLSEGMAGRFYKPNGDALLVRGFKESRVEVQKYLNRRDRLNL